jgi:hypothetical protein
MKRRHGKGRKASINKLNDAMDAMRRPGSRMIQTNYQGWPNAVGVDRGLLHKIVRAEIGAWVRENQSDGPSAAPGAAVRASAKSFRARSAEEMDVIEDKSKRRYSVGGATS